MEFGLEASIGLGGVAENRYKRIATHDPKLRLNRPTKTQHLSSWANMWSIEMAFSNYDIPIQCMRFTHR